MLNYFNLIVTTFRHREKALINECIYLLDKTGDPNAQFHTTNIFGIVTGITNVDPFLMAKYMRDLWNREPTEFRYLLRLIPIGCVLNSELNEIRSRAISLFSFLEQSKKIDGKDTFRVTVEKRHCNSIRTRDIIGIIAKEVSNPVDLDNPKWIILIEILGKVTGISVLEPDQIFSTVIEMKNRAVVDR
ncbi:MAG TPA: THUMP domain-containing protein [Nitrososphaeraceae archaeon]|nr:THUMP domain-containing protein [Nitrososphaeraceae archaeon]